MLIEGWNERPKIKTIDRFNRWCAERRVNLYEIVCQINRERGCYVEPKVRKEITRKICTRCREEKDRKDFYITNKKLNSWCIKCYRFVAKQRRIKGKLEGRIIVKYSKDEFGRKI